MKSGKIGRSGLVMVFFLAFSLMLGVGFLSVTLAKGQEGSKYVGVKKCKNCHDSKVKGDQYGKWKESKLSKTYDLLASELALETGKKVGVSEPQKSPKCLKCHVTAYEEPDDRKDKKFDPKLGVQCESCHGPGGFHVKSRLTAAAEDDSGDDLFEEDGDEEYLKLPKGEINATPDEKVCIKCHNEESPQFKPFDFEERKEKFLHHDPRKKR